MFSVSKSEENTVDDGLLEILAALSNITNMAQTCDQSIVTVTRSRRRAQSLTRQNVFHVRSQSMHRNSVTWSNALVKRRQSLQIHPETETEKRFRRTAPKRSQREIKQQLVRGTAFCDDVLKKSKHRVNI